MVFEELGGRLMFLITLVFAGVLVIAASIQLLLAELFWRHFNGLQRVRIAADPQPKVSVLMCVRGCDPSLRGGLLRLLQQNYEHYEIHLVIDNQLDTAWRVAQEVKCEFDPSGRIRIHELQQRSPTCGLKCSALIEGVGYLSPDSKYLLLTDSDVITHPHWIADLVGPLEADAQVGLVCGTQWFEPPADSTWGALVRSSWNAGAMVPTIYFQNPWAGTIAMRVEDVRQGKFSEVWRRSMVDDGPLTNLIRARGRSIRFAPSLIMVNEENCTFAYACGWVSRMLTWSKLYEPTFFLSVIHAVFSNSIMIGLFLLLGVAIANVDGRGAAVAAIGLVISGILSVAAYRTSRRAARRSCELSGRELPVLSGSRLIKLFFTVPIAQVVYLYGVIQAAMAHRICWRGISYEIRGRHEIRMIAYAPFRPSGQSPPNTSI